jgi:hypothetical protein
VGWEEVEIGTALSNSKIQSCDVVPWAEICTGVGAVPHVMLRESFPAVLFSFVSVPATFSPPSPLKQA